MRNLERRRQGGFSLVEMVMVVAILLAIAAYAIPNILSAMSNYRVKNTMNQAIGLLQQQRMTAVRLNQTYVIRSSTTSDNRTIAWFELTSGNQQWDSGEPMIEFPSSVVVQNSGHPGDATSSSAANFTAQGSSVPIQFNARGLPCKGSPCSNWDSASSTPVGFVAYFKGTSNYGQPVWGAVTISPSGRIRSWFYNGSSYSPL